VADDAARAIPRNNITVSEAARYAALDLVLAVPHISGRQHAHSPSCATYLDGQWKMDSAVIFFSAADRQHCRRRIQITEDPFKGPNADPLDHPGNQW
jgi:hypothetical protein